MEASAAVEAAAAAALRFAASARSQTLHNAFTPLLLQACRVKASRGCSLPHCGQTLVAGSATSGTGITAVTASEALFAVLVHSRQEPRSPVEVRRSREKAAAGSSSRHREHCFSAGGSCGS